MTDRKNPLLLAAVCDFGWGSLGKLRLILDRLPAMDVALFGNSEIVNATRHLLGSRQYFCDRHPQEADVAVVINHPAAANKIGELDVPVIYVDSLPYLWMTADEIPNLSRVAYYCAQRYPQDRQPVGGPLQGRDEIIWIDPIVPVAKHRRGGQGVVVNMGGLHSHLVGDTIDAYLNVVLFPLIKILQESERTVSAVCGNLPPTACQRVANMLPNCAFIGAQTPYEFERILKAADLLVTSPGSTTILQAMSIRLPTLLLPPQNLSQIFNARIYANHGAQTMQWPAGVLASEEIERLRPQGEDAVLAYVYACIAKVATSTNAAAEVAAIMRKSISGAPGRGVLDQSVLPPGSGGAGQVARLIKQAMFAPIPRATSWGPVTEGR
jgi:hydroxymethylcytosylglucuronate/cytosylglucuronate synthase